MFLAACKNTEIQITTKYTLFFNKSVQPIWIKLKRRLDSSFFSAIQFEILFYFIISIILGKHLLPSTVVQLVKYRNNCFGSYIQNTLGTKSTEWARDASFRTRAPSDVQTRRVSHTLNGPATLDIQSSEQVKRKQASELLKRK